MKVFFNHIAKCGGSTINNLAHKAYGEDFHRLGAGTGENELRKILEKEHFFITSELNSVSAGHLQALLSDPSIVRIVLTRDPIERFKSFVSHSTRDSPREGKCSFWGNEFEAPSISTTNGWMTACLSRAEQIMTTGSHHVYNDQNLLFAIYSQWMLCSFMSYIDINANNAELLGSANAPLHIKRYRDNCKNISLDQQIGKILRSLYKVVGATEKLGDFVENLISHNILPRESIPDTLPRINSSRETIDPALAEIKEELSAKYYGMLPEDFILHGLCSKFSDDIKSHAND